METTPQQSPFHNPELEKALERIPLNFPFSIKF
jgi:hypothetical protein